MKLRIFGALAVSVGTLGLAACSSEPEQEAQEELAGDPEAPEGITVDQGRLSLPAVSGNPGAVYFTVSNNGDAEMAIRSVFVEGASMAMLHQTRDEAGVTRMEEANEVEVPAGQTLGFEPGGLHVMAMDLDETMQAGDETEVTLTFASGDKVSFPAFIRAPGDAN